MRHARIVRRMGIVILARELQSHAGTRSGIQLGVTIPASLEYGPFVLPSKLTLESYSREGQCETMGGGGFDRVGEAHVAYVQVGASYSRDGNVESGGGDGGGGESEGYFGEESV